MTRKARFGMAFLGIAVLAPPAIWLIVRPRVPIEFLDKRPNATFIFPEEFSGKPWLDWKAPGGTRIVYPTKRKLLSGTVDSCIAGYLYFSKPAMGAPGLYLGDDRLQVEGDEIPLQYAFVHDDGKGASRAIPAAGHSAVLLTASKLTTTSSFAGFDTIRAVPFATEEKYRRATLFHGTESYPVRLPVSTAFGPSERRSEIFKIGPYHVFAKPRPWKVTTQDIAFELTTDAPAGTKVLISFKWKLTGKAGTTWYDQNQNYLLEGQGKPAKLVIRRSQPMNNFEAQMQVLEQFELPLRVKRPNKNALQLFLPSGRRIYNGAIAKGMSKEGIYVVDVRGRRLIEGDWSSLRDGRPYTFAAMKDGETVTATAFRSRLSETAKGAFDVPPAMTNTAQIAISTGIASYTIIQAGP